MERERRIEAERRVTILRANMVKVKSEDMGSILECSFFIQYNPLRKLCCFRVTGDVSEI
jgi:hypothetical protein